MPNRRQDIIWTNDDLLLIIPRATYSNEIFEIQRFSLKKNAYENVVCEMAANLPRPQCVNI